MAQINPLYPITELTQAQYDALGVKDANTLYAIPLDGVSPSHQRPASGSTLPCILITQADYDALGTYDENTLYCIHAYDETKIAVVLLDENDEPTADVTYVDSISEAASYLNDNLSNRYLVHIGKSSGVTDIGAWAFRERTSLVYIDIPDTVTRIGGGAFEWTSLKTVSLPDGITELFSNTFRGCNELESIHLPLNLSKTDSGNFSNCTALTSINVPETWLIWGSNEFNSCFSLEEIILPTNLQTIMACTFDQCTSIKNMIIPNSVTTIGEEAFDQCESLESVTIPNSVITIDDGAFRLCKSLTEMLLPESVSSIGSDAFERQSTGNRYPVCIDKVCNSVSGSPWGAEDYSIHWMKKVGIYSANNDGSRASFIANFDTLALAIDYLNNNSSGRYCISCGDTAEESMPAVQMKTSLYGLFLSGSSLTLNPAAFAGNSNLRYISIGIGMQTIPISCFASCQSLATVYIGKNVEVISDNAFAGCTALQNITIPANVEQISASAFNGCFGLTSITVNKPENSISGAPWGASNATVVWTG